MKKYPDFPLQTRIVAGLLFPGVVVVYFLTILKFYRRTDGKYPVDRMIAILQGSKKEEEIFKAGTLLSLSVYMTIALILLAYFGGSR